MIRNIGDHAPHHVKYEPFVFSDDISEIISGPGQYPLDGHAILLRDSHTYNRRKR